MRNFDVWLTLKSTVFAAVLAANLQMGVTFGQPPRLVMLPQKNNAPQSDASGGNAATQAQPVDQYLELIDRAIEITSKRYLTANSHSPWQIFHCILATRQECVLRLGKEKVNAIQWLSTSEPQFDKEPWLLLTPHGAKFHSYTKKYFFEGHPAQFMALLTHSNLPLDHEFHVQGKVVTLNDMINNIMKEVNTNEEVTWVLWTLQHYLKPDATWINQANEPWSIERLVQIESSAPTVGAPCGGNHRLFALTRTRDKFLKSGGSLRGVWLLADQKIRQHIDIARSLQNSDGTFSAASYKGPMHTNDVNERFNTTGHTMEFLSIALPDQRLNEQWVRNAVWMLARELIINKDTQIDCGPLFHSLDALILYRDRVRPKPATVEPPQVITSAPVSSDVTLNNQPAPAATSQPAEKVPETSKPESTADNKADMKVESKPETKPEEPKPLDVKPEGPAAQPIPEVKPPEPTVSKAIDSKAKPVRMEFTKSRNAVKAPDLPKIDPSKLSSVGQAAPQHLVDNSNSGAPRKEPRRQPPGSAPALLPEIDAMPLTQLEVPPKKPLSEPVAMKGNKIAAALPDNPDKELSALIPPIIPSMPSDDEPASAINPENAHANSNEDS